MQHSLLEEISALELSPRLLGDADINSGCVYKRHPLVHY